MNGLPASIGQFETSGIVAALILFAALAAAFFPFFFHKELRSYAGHSGQFPVSQEGTHANLPRKEPASPYSDSGQELRAHIPWLAIAAAMILAFVPSAQMTANAQTSGTCGATAQDCSWEFSNGTLTISGSGPMTDFLTDSQVYPPWERLQNDITHLVINGVTSIGDGASNGHYELTSVTISETVKSIGKAAFNCCISLESITIPDSVTFIGGNAFFGCIKLSSVAIPEGVKIIGPEAFMQCDNLSSVKMPGSVEIIGNDVFKGCADPIHIYYNGTADEWSNVRKVGDLAENPIVHTLHTLKIDYVYADNSEAAPSYSASVIGGTAYSVDSPVIEGFIPDKEVSGTMPDEDLSVTVTYLESSFPLKVEFVFLKHDGSRGVPFDIKEGTLNPVLTLRKGDEAVSKSGAVKLEIKAMATEASMTVSFSKKLDDLAPGKYAVVVSGLPKEMEKEVPNSADAPKYKLSAKAEINRKNGGIVITVYLIWDDGNSPEEPVVYPLPEDEIGAYWLRGDGTKEYLLFHTYDICMAWLGKAELCEGPERCFHKDGK